MITRDNVRTYTDYAYAAHDQAVFLYEAMNEIKSMHESHFMTKKNKELIRDKKALEDELHLAKSMGPADGKAAVSKMNMQEQLKTSYNDHAATANRIKEIEGQYRGLIEQERSKAERA